MNTNTATITANVIPAASQTADDVLAAALGTQHERNLIESSAAHRVSDNLVTLVIKYDKAGGKGEVEDAAERLRRTPSMGVDAIRIRY